MAEFEEYKNEFIETKHAYIIMDVFNQFYDNDMTCFDELSHLIYDLWLAFGFKRTYNKQHLISMKYAKECLKDWIPFSESIENDILIMQKYLLEKHNIDVVITEK